MTGLASVLKDYTCRIAMIAIVGATIGSGCTGPATDTETLSASEYGRWEAVGRYAADLSLDLIAKESRRPRKGNMIVMTNAGYAEVNGSSTQGALDGLVSATGAGRGKNTLIEIRSCSWVPLWFAVFDRESGYCAYTEPDPAEVAATDEARAKEPEEIFAIAAVERIDANHLFEHTADYGAKFNDKVFGGNEFRIVTIANAVAAGAPAHVVRTLEFHNHYCPGVTSGIMIASYVKSHFPPQKSGYFVHALEPWCKEDALMVLLGATPGNESYAVSYPTGTEKAAGAPEAEKASTIIYRRNDETKKWEGLALAFEWADTSCPESGNGVIDKLCMDLWYLDHLDKPGDFVKVVGKFELPDGVSPQSLANQEADPLQRIGPAAGGPAK